VPIHGVQGDTREKESGRVGVGVRQNKNKSRKLRLNARPDTAGHLIGAIKLFQSPHMCLGGRYRLIGWRGALHAILLVKAVTTLRTSYNATL